MFKHPAVAAATLIAAGLLLPAGMAVADCQSDFARDNRVKPEAGPFKTTEERVPTSRLDDGRWVPTLRQGKVTTISEVVPARKAFRITTDAPFGDHYVGVGDRVWTRSGTEGEWAAMGADDAKLFAGATARYVLADDMSDLTCSASQHEGRAVRVYRYHVPGDGLSSTITTITAQFDPRSGLPLTVASEGSAKSNAFTSSGRFVFDRGIQIQPPVKGATRR